MSETKLHTHTKEHGAKGKRKTKETLGTGF
jgi:hypothetical protein